MDTTNAPDLSRRIDLTSGVDVQFWCGVFHVTMEQLRDAVHHAGHQADEVQRYLDMKRQRPA